ncbi:hypothetical protein AB0L10_43145 [Streptomyces flaveolus]|uniref:hypothetical protein n=1 Tax=Streptomyces flaveolus TaxID=67297 RepID=UPI00343E8750
MDADAEVEVLVPGDRDRQYDLAVQVGDRRGRRVTAAAANTLRTRWLLPSPM